MNDTQPLLSFTERSVYGCRVKQEQPYAKPYVLKIYEKLCIERNVLFNFSPHNWRQYFGLSTSANEYEKLDDNAVKNEQAKSVGFFQMVSRISC